MALMILYTCYNDSRAVVKNLTELARANVVYKDNTSLTMPRVIVQTSAESRSTNYVYLTDFDRYYFVKNRTFTQGNRIILELDADDLFNAYNRGLNNCACIANRSSNRFNTYLYDEKYPELSYGQPVTKSFSKQPFKKEWSTILTVAGGV